MFVVQMAHLPLIFKSPMHYPRTFFFLRSKGCASRPSFFNFLLCLEAFSSLEEGLSEVSIDI